MGVRGGPDRGSRGGPDRGSQGRGVGGHPESVSDTSEALDFISPTHPPWAVRLEWHLRGARPDERRREALVLAGLLGR